MSTKILVTGGAGFIGSHLVDYLIFQNHKVTVLDNLSSGNLTNINKKADFQKTSLEDNKNIISLFNLSKFKIVFHLAAVPAVSASTDSALKEFKTTITGIINLIETGAKNNLKTFVYFSSAAVYSPDAVLPIAEFGKIDPISYYGLSKLIGEYLVINLCKIYKMRYVIFRPANVYGPRQRVDGEGGVVASFVGNLMRNENIKIFGNGKKTRDFIYVDDVISACVLVTKKDLSGIYNLGTTKQTSINELAGYLQNIARKKTTIEYSKDRVGEVKNSSLDYKKIRNVSWTPKTNLELGLKVTWDNFNKQ